MANNPRRGSASLPYRHAKDEVALVTAIPPALKDALVDRAAAEGVWLKVIVKRALEREVAA